MLVDDTTTTMFVIKRDGTSEKIFFDKINKRNSLFCSELGIDPSPISQKVIQSLTSGIKTSELDVLSAETALFMATLEPRYEIFAKRVIIDNMHKETPVSFLEVTERLNEVGFLDESYYSFINQNSVALQEMLDFDRDFRFDYFGYKTLERSYLQKDSKQKMVERPQHMWLRVATFIRMPDLEMIKVVYDQLSTLQFTHATPTLFNAGIKYAQLASCFLISMDDSLTSIYETLHKTALISKFAGGIGINISMVRGSGSKIKSTNGVSSGIIPMLKNFNETARYVNQAGKRKGSIAVYLEPWHPDIIDFLNMRRNHVHENMRCLDLFSALWIPDLFMKRLQTNQAWSLFDPSVVEGLYDLYGEEFEKVYIQAELEGKFTSQIQPQEIWRAMLDSQIETGTPYVHFKDNVNKKSNQKNIGVVRGSNLCCEITEVSQTGSIACCNLASVSLPSHLGCNGVDYEKLRMTVHLMVENMNIIIDKTFYPVDDCKTNNKSHRPIGLGVQGLADVLQILRYAWDSEECKQLNKNIFETIYFSALEKSCEISKELGPYSSFEGSPASQGILQFDMWNVVPGDRHDWDGLKEDIKKFGIRNSLLVAPMPTASTAQILGNTESFEARTSNIYSRRVLSGEFPVVNKYLYNDLNKIGMWNKNIVNQIINNGGSIQAVVGIPDEIKKLYKTVWEVPMKIFADLAIDRGAFVDQSQSFNAYFPEPDVKKISSLLMYTWSKGLKCGMYYLRTKPNVNAIKFTVTRDEKEEVCVSCSG